jgi:hypothetical protein
MKGYHLVLFSIITLAVSAGSCDRTDIRGSSKISIPSTNLFVGIPTKLHLEVPRQFTSNLHHVFWLISPEQKAHITWKTNTGSDRSISNDRMAIITPKMAGQIEIAIYAFYGPQTSPQRVTSLTCTVFP